MLFRSRLEEARDRDGVGSDSGRAVLLVSIKQGSPPERLEYCAGRATLGTACSQPAVERVVRRWRTTGRLPGAMEDFLFRRAAAPFTMRKGRSATPMWTAVHGVCAGTTLCVQGPPGSGKTYNGARMIVALLRAGKRVGIASNSHRAINVLLAGDAGTRPRRAALR